MNEVSLFCPTTKKSLLGKKSRKYLQVQVLQRHSLDGIDVERRVGVHDGEAARDKELLGAGRAALGGQDVDDAGLELGNGRDVVREDTHVSVGGGEIDLGRLEVLEERDVGEGEINDEALFGAGGCLGGICP